MIETLLQPVRDYLRDLWSKVAHGWDAFWFKPTDPTSIAAIRVFAGCIMLYIHLMTLGHFMRFVGPEAWVDSRALHQLRFIPEDALDPNDLPFHQWHAQSVWFYIQDPVAMWIIQGVFLAAMVCLILGLFSRVSALLVWVGHVSYLHRAYITWFGMDVVLCMIILYLIFAPSGATLSLDRLIARFRATRKALGGKGTVLPELTLQESWAANTVTRMIQVHMCVIYLCAGLAKLQGNMWWNGWATWHTMVMPEFELISMRWIALTPEWFYQGFMLATVFFTLGFEIGFAFFIWLRVLRPLVLTAALFLHGGIGLFMGLGGFGFAMLTGCYSFVAPQTTRWLLSVFFKGPSGFRFVYDREDPRQIRQVSWIRAADAFNQVEVVEAHSPRASAGGGSLVTPEGTVVHGTAAFWRLVRALRCLWIAWPVAFWSFARASTPELTSSSAK